MKTLVRSLLVAVVLAIAGGAVPVAAQRVWVDVRIGTPGYQYRHYRHGDHWYREYRQYHRSYGWQYRRPVIVVGPRWHYGRPYVVHRQHRVRRHHRWH